MRLSPAQIPACALTHGAPASDDDERPLVRPRVLKPMAETRETSTQGRHRKCVLHCPIGCAEWSIPPTGWVLTPGGSIGLGVPTRWASGAQSVRHPSGILFAAFSIRSAAMTLSPQTEYGASFSLIAVGNRLAPVPPHRFPHARQPNFSSGRLIPAHFGRHFRVTIVDFLAVSVRVGSLKVVFGFRLPKNFTRARPSMRHQRSMEVNCGAD